jgi:hypothetical protein
LNIKVKISDALGKRNHSSSFKMQLNNLYHDHSNIDLQPSQSFWNSKTKQNKKQNGNSHSGVYDMI